MAGKGQASLKSAAQALVSEIRAYCEAHADPALANKYERYFAEGYDAWGLLDKENPFWHSQRDTWAEAYEAKAPDVFFLAGESLFQSGKYEEGAMAIQLLKPYRDDLKADWLPALARWFDGGVRNWAHTDVLCGEILGPGLVDGRIKLKDLEPWRASPHKYQRRAAAVALTSTVKSAKDPRQMLKFVTPFMNDPEKVVHQGTGWLLRELWKRWPEPVEAFLLEWKQTAPRLIFQYATEKMTKEQKARFRRS